MIAFASTARATALWLLLTATTLVAATPFEEACQRYEAQKYSDAKARFEEVQASGAVSANLLYDLGNTEYRLGSPGRAILQYERALALEPSHPEARANLTLLRSKTGAQLLDLNVLDRLVPPLPESVFTIATAVGAWLFLFAAAAILFLGRRESAGAWFALLLGLLTAAWSGLALWRNAEAGAVAIVLETTANALTAPADRAAVVEPLPAGSEVRVLSRRGEWTYCEISGARRGWLSSRAIESLRQPSAS